MGKSSNWPADWNSSRNITHSKERAGTASSKQKRICTSSPRQKRLKLLKLFRASLRSWKERGGKRGSNLSGICRCWKRSKGEISTQWWRSWLLSDNWTKRSGSDCCYSWKGRSCRYKKWVICWPVDRMTSRPSKTLRNNRYSMTSAKRRHSCRTSTPAS